MVKLEDIRGLIIGRTDKIVDICVSEKTIYFESEEGHNYTLCFKDEPDYIEFDVSPVYDCTSEIIEGIALEYKELKKKMKE